MGAVPMGSMPEPVAILSPLAQDGSAAVIRAWLKAEGDPVTEGEPLLELETDKVAMEVTAPATGRLAAILVREGEVQPGLLLGHIVPEAAAPPAGAEAPPAVPEHRLSPAVRKLLRESGLDPARLEGTGRDGRLTRHDVVLAMRQPQVAPPPAGETPRVTRVPHSPMRRTIAGHMAHSVATAPHVTAVFEADLGAIVAHRAAHRAAFAARGVALTYSAYFLRAAVRAMAAAPAVNSRWHEDHLEIFQDVHIGIGTALGEEGLVVPVVREAQSLSLFGLAERVQDLTARARAGRLRPEAMQGGTFTVSNHGVSGSLLAAPVIIHQPQAAILGIGRMEKRVVVRESGGQDAILVRPMAYVSLTIDHRVLDGSQTNAWLSRFVQVLEGWDEE
ncbi:2-oxo acid dehydrogenase subunit E2 [Roseomonas sp. GC11]|uniref:dihydrolipoamide acetyltransferase family protein n=1 Tax=Roseomonas sp. GC11 TaxID=2950546 RepID=UPI002108DAD3|nr:2-oxo acid dehydrogenase subunit E2 [Roseomonas sp. GC11]MCQ4160651.1 2-oxo acid dehydrogenase subunit E2 [Roseomonas sp. GC11]